MIEAFFRQRRGGLLAGALLLMAVAAIACGSSDDPTATTAPATNPTATATSAVSGTAEPTATTAATAKPDSLGTGGTLRIAITAADVPLTDQQTDQGAEGNRWAGYPLGDGLVKWELGQDDHVPGFIPGIAETWEIDPADPTRWVFHLRDGATFQDGTPIDATAVGYNYDRVLNEEAPFYNSTLGAGKGSAKLAIDRYGIVDDSTFEIFSAQPDSFLLYEVVALFIHSMDAMEAAGADYKNHPYGSGAFEFVSQQARTQLTMQPFESYYDDNARLDRLIILPMPEATTRLAALRNSEVDWIEVPPPDAIPGLESSGFQIYTTQTAHNWPYQFNLSKAPYDNKLVRQAFNYAIDREALCRDLLNNTCEPGLSFANQATPWVGDSESQYSYDPEKAKALLAEAGITTPLEFKVLISASGSGQMLPVPMNEFVQRNLAAVGIDMQIDVIEWNTYITQIRNGSFSNPDLSDYDAVNVSWLSVDPSGFIRLMYSTSYPPAGFNMGGYNNPMVDQLIDNARATTDLSERDALLTQANEMITDDAPWVFVVHDRNPRVLTANVKNYVQEKHTYTSVVNVWVE
jgi:peptide/nickel transport system substrate-binding protein